EAAGDRLAGLGPRDRREAGVDLGRAVLVRAGAEVARVGALGLEAGEHRVELPLRDGRALLVAVVLAGAVVVGALVDAAVGVAAAERPRADREAGGDLACALVAHAGRVGVARGVGAAGVAALEERVELALRGRRGLA